MKSRKKNAPPVITIVAFAILCANILRIERKIKYGKAQKKKKKKRKSTYIRTTWLENIIICIYVERAI